MADERTYPTFQRMPAVLLRLPLAEVTEAIRQNGGRPARGAMRSWFAQTYVLEAEPFFASFLKHRHRPMSVAEIHELGLATPTLASYWGKCN